MVNFLKNKDVFSKYLAVAFGRQRVKGYPWVGKVTGTSPTPQITAFNALGEGEWALCEGAFWKGVWIPPTDYEFKTGALATGMTTGNQTVCSYFPKDVPHTRTAGIGYKVPVGLGNPDIENNTPSDFEGIFQTKLTPDFDNSGTQTDFSYSPNPARCIIELLQTYCRLPNLPSLYASAAEYWLSRIDWGAWIDFRDFHEQPETVDYTTIPNFEGFGLTANFYNGTNFDTWVKKFVQPTLDFSSSSAAQASGVSATNFSARFEGFIKAQYSETMTFHAAHDNGVRVYITTAAGSYGSPVIDQWASDGSTTAGTHTGTYAMTADTFYKIKVEWNSSTTPSLLKLEWSSTSQTQAVISHKNFYPKRETRPLYEFHGYFNVPVYPSFAIREILRCSNSIQQDVNGKLRFFCLEQLSSSFNLTNANIDSFEFKRRDILMSDPVTIYEGDFNDLDLEYMEKPTTSVQIYLDYLTRKNAEIVKVVPLYNSTRWQARKVLLTQSKLEVGNDLIATAKCKTSLTYPVIAGDKITVTHRKTGNDPIDYLVREAIDHGVSESEQLQTQEAEKRTFILQQWG